MDPKLTENYRAAQRTSVFLKEPQKFETKPSGWGHVLDMLSWALIAAAVVTIAVYL